MFKATMKSKKLLYIFMLLMLPIVIKYAWNHNLDGFLGDYKVGEVWSYKTSNVENNSTVEIIEYFSDSKYKAIYAVRIIGSNLSSPLLITYYPDGAPFYFVTQKTLDNSVIEKLEANKLSTSTLKSYEAWNEYSLNEGIHDSSLEVVQENLDKAWYMDL